MQPSTISPRCQYCGSSIPFGEPHCDCWTSPKEYKESCSGTPFTRVVGVCVAVAVPLLAALTG